MATSSTIQKSTDIPRNLVDITPGDASDAGVVQVSGLFFLLVTVAGDVKMGFNNDTTLTLTGLPAGAMIKDFCPRKIYATGTTATVKALC